MSAPWIMGIRRDAIRRVSALKCTPLENREEEDMRTSRERLKCRLSVARDDKLSFGTELDPNTNKQVDASVTAGLTESDHHLQAPLSLFSLARFALNLISGLTDLGLSVCELQESSNGLLSTPTADFVDATRSIPEAHSNCYELHDINAEASLRLVQFPGIGRQSYNKYVAYLAHMESLGAHAHDHYVFFLTYFFPRY
ncbi:hypothetical protein BV25DRAFT_1835146 [Artomyces pyxidatus]|uniref:Uncharacterized protein n=1 Tax=Artomyces pyxidatus TaxID=48021 RepID=A0ACB8TGG3_9AGAM|nr:hypothetical protein BV25DRAFT_1835146 [Artomyces pyxidatus]